MVITPYDNLPAILHVICKKKYTVFKKRIRNLQRRGEEIIVINSNLL